MKFENFTHSLTITIIPSNDIPINPIQSNPINHYERESETFFYFVRICECVLCTKLTNKHDTIDTIDTII